MSYRGGMRGGLAVQGHQPGQVMLPPPDVAEEGQNGEYAHETPQLSRLRRVAYKVLPQRTPGDDQVWDASKLSRVQWSLSLVGFLTYIFVIVTYRLGIADVGMALALVGLIFLNQGLRFPPFLMGMGVLYLWTWVTWVGTSYPDAVYDAIVGLGKLWLIVLVAVNVLRTRANIRLYMILFLLFYAAYPARGTIINYLVGYTLFGRALWNFVFANPNDLAAITLLALSMATAVLIADRNRWFRLGAFAATIVLTVVILMTKSRGVFLGVSVFGVLALLPQLKRLRNVAVALVIVAGILLLAPSDVFDRVGGLRYAVDTENLAAVDEEQSAEQRYAIWKVSWAIIAENPLTGVGFGVYNVAHGAHAERVDPSRLSWGNRDAHSTYFNLAATIGVPGLMMFLALIGGVLLHAERARRRCQTVLPRTAQQLFFLQMGLVGFLVAGIFASYGRISFLYLHLALIYVVAQACNDDMDRFARQRLSALRNS